MDAGIPVLESMVFCPACGSDRFKVFEDAGRCCETCGYTLFSNPSSAAAVFIQDETGQVLTFRRQRKPSLGKLALPGGFLDSMETLEEAAIREAREEVGLDVHTVRYLTSYPNQYVYRGILYYTINTYFVSNEFSGEIVAQEGEVGKWAWVDPIAVDSSEWAFPSLQHAVSALCSE